MTACRAVLFSAYLGLVTAGGQQRNVKTPSRHQFLQASASAKARAAQNVLDLNARAFAASEELEYEIMQCDAFESDVTSTLSTLSLDMLGVNSQTSGDVASQTQSSRAMDFSNEGIEALEEDAKKTDVNCKLRTATLKSQLSMLSHDMQTAVSMQGIVNQCATQVALVQICAGSEGAVVAPAMRLLHLKGRRLKTRVARESLARAMRNAYAKHVSRRSFPSKSDPKSTHKRKAGNACSVGDKVHLNCHDLRIEFSRLMGNLEHEQSANTGVMQEHVTACQSRDNFLQEEIGASRRMQLQSGQSLSRTMGRLSSLATTRDNLQFEHTKLTESLGAKKAECGQLSSKLESEISDAISMRQMYAQEAAGAQLPPIQDCEMGEWNWLPCSQHCSRDGNAGVKKGNRAMLVPPGANGLGCPPSVASVPCGSQKCPQDCVMSPWQPWSECSKACGGGTESRTRDVDKNPQNGGLSCAVPEERRVCNTESCDVDCELAEWTGWSHCSRSCRFSKTSAAGRRHRERSIMESPQGAQGKCPSKFDPSRYQVDPCNDEICPANITCAAEMDVIVLVDGSDPEKFKAQLGLVQGLLNISREPMRYAVVAYGSSTKVLSTMTGDLQGLPSKLQAATAPGGDPDLAQGEGLGRLLLQSEVLDRSVVVLALSDGRPTREDNAISAAEGIRRAGARLFVGLVDDHTAPPRATACNIASHPCDANVQSVDSWEQMATSPERFLVAICSQLTMPPVEDALGEPVNMTLVSDTA